MGNFKLDTTYFTQIESKQSSSPLDKKPKFTNFGPLRQKLVMTLNSAGFSLKKTPKFRNLQSKSAEQTRVHLVLIKIFNSTQIALLQYK